MTLISVELAAEMLKSAGYTVRRNDGKVLNANTTGHHLTMHVTGDRQVDREILNYVLKTHSRNGNDER